MTGIRLRPWEAGDEAVLARLLDNRNIWRNMTNGIAHPYTREDAQKWIAFASEDSDGERHFAVDRGGEIVGGAGFNRLTDLSTRSAEIGYWIGEAYWGRGIATEALRLATENAFADFDFVRLQAHVLGWNAASGRVLEKCGYEHEATLRRHGFKDGEVCDMWIFALLRQ